MNNESLNLAEVKETKIKIFLRFIRFGLLAWGGPIAQIAMIRDELVEKEKWITKEKFNRALAVYQVLPGPEAHELCVYFGMIAGGRWGGFLAGLGFMLPGFLLMLLLTWFYIQTGLRSPMFEAVFTGFQAAVIALIISAVHRIGKHSLINLKLILIAALSAIAYFSGVSFFIVLPFAGLIYILVIKRKKAGIFVVIILLIISGYNLYNGIFIDENIAAAFHKNEETDSSPMTIFFSGLKGGLLTFGGAYTVIPFIQEDAVVNNRWMTNEQFLDGIALSGILPAPLIIFTTFVGYFAGGWVGSIIITAAIFLPAFCFTLIGHNYLEKIIENRSLHDLLDGITAGVIGLITVTAIQLFIFKITDVLTLTICMLSLFFLYIIKSKFTVVYVIIGSGLISLIIR